MDSLTFCQVSLKWNSPAFSWHDSWEFLTMILVLVLRSVVLVLERNILVLQNGLVYITG